MPRTTTNITYLLGAGASFFACPIWKEQGQKMIELANFYFKDDNIFSNSKPKDLSEKKQIIWDIGYFGTKALVYGTIDTYAKKLNLNNSYSELNRLKLAVSVFFTIWQLTENQKLKTRGDYKFEDIDKRYISLMAAILHTSNNNNNKLKENIRFVTWNYDLQLEFAFKSFCHDNLSWDIIFQDLKFRINDNDNSELDICHLNGYHGFYKTSKQEQHLLDRTDSKSIDDILNNLSFTTTSQRQGSLDITNHINYAWETNPIATKARNEAKKIFSKTDILVIIGYSFPNFNKDIDIELFKELKGRKTKIYYQDPNASSSFIHQLVNKNESEIICENFKLDNFILPYEF